MHTYETQVLIVGAGPTGLALACDLARRHVQFRIIDKAPEFFIGSKGKGLQPRSLEVFDDFGIVEEILACGKFHLPFRAYDGSRVLGERDAHEGRYPTPSTPYASPLLIPQWRVEEKLRNLLHQSGAQVELATELISFEQDEHGVSATVSTPSGHAAIHSQYLVAADGGRSFVRKALDVPFEGETWKDERMYVGDVHLRGLDRDAWHAWPNHPGGFLALCPLPSTDAFQLQAALPPGEEREPSLELFREMVRERANGMDIDILDAPWLSLYRANVRMVSKYRIGRVFLAGDAAHVHSPAGGQGMNTGMQDAYNLSWKLSSVLNGAPEALLDTYEEERLPVAASVLGISTKLHRQITLGGEDQVRRDAVTLQLGITYKEMSLSRHSGAPQLKLASGDRAPDATGQDAKGHAIRLFDLFRGPHFTLLRLFPSELQMEQIPHVKIVDIRATVPATQAPELAQTFVDAHGHFSEAFGGSGDDLILVRPDGYIGWTGESNNLPDLQAYLAQVLPQ